MIRRPLSTKAYETILSERSCEEVKKEELRKELLLKNIYQLEKEDELNNNLFPPVENISGGSIDVSIQTIDVDLDFEMNDKHENMQAHKNSRTGNEAHEIILPAFSNNTGGSSYTQKEINIYETVGEILGGGKERRMERRVKFGERTESKRPGENGSNQSLTVTDDDSIFTEDGRNNERCCLDKFCKKSYTQCHAFSSIKARSAFFGKIFALKFIQFFLCLIFVTWVIFGACDEFKNKVLESYNWMYLACALLLISQITVRCLCKFRANSLPMFVILGVLFFNTFFISWMSIAVVVKYPNSYALYEALVIISTGLLLLAIIPQLARLNVFKNQIYSLNFALNMVPAVIIVVSCLLSNKIENPHNPISEAKLVQEQQIILFFNWLPAVFIALGYTTMEIFEAQLLMRGFYFPIRDDGIRNWIFSAIYI